MKKIKLKDKSKIEFEICSDNYRVHVKTTHVSKIAMKETKAKRKSKAKKTLIRSKAWKFICTIIEKMVTAIISAIVNGLFYQFLIRKKNEFFYKKGMKIWLKNY